MNAGSLLAQSADPDVATKWVGFGVSIAFALGLVRVLIWYQKTFLTEARTEISQLRAQLALATAAAEEARRTAFSAQSTAQQYQFDIAANRHQIAVLKRQLAEAFEIPEVVHPDDYTRRSDDETAPGT